ncbi:MAG: hypothetical protein ABR600_02120 [Actinomycetota bacterium]
MDNAGSVVAGYLLTFAALAGYALSVAMRARRARARAEAMAEARSR